jgi:hypothetical protein
VLVRNATPRRIGAPVRGACAQVSLGAFNSSSNGISAFDSILNEIVLSRETS